MHSQFEELARKIISQSDAAVRALAVKILRANRAGISLMKSEDSDDVWGVQIKLVKSSRNKNDFIDLKMAADVIISEKNVVRTVVVDNVIVIASLYHGFLAQGVTSEDSNGALNLKKAGKRFNAFVKDLFAEIGINPRKISRKQTAAE